MCFIKLKNAKLKTAKRNIAVYKLCIRVKDFPDKAIPQWRNNKLIYKKDKLNREINLCGLNTIERGYHSYKDKFSGNSKFIIPKGSKYYYNPQREEYVSSNIIFNGWL